MYHRTPTRYSNTRSRSASRRSLSASATNDGAKVPRSSRIVAAAPDTRVATKKHVQLAMNVIEKNLRTDMAASDGYGRASLRFRRRYGFGYKAAPYDFSR